MVTGWHAHRLWEYGWDCAGLEPTTGKRLVTYRGHTNGVQAVAWSPDGTRIASASWDTTVQVWEATTGRQVFTYRGHNTIVGALAWSPNGERIVSVADDVRVWQAS